MKLCKVKIIKEQQKGGMACIYPEGYSREDHYVLSHPNEHIGVCYSLTTVADDFVFTDDMVEVNKLQADDVLEERASREGRQASKTVWRERKKIYKSGV